ncbi:MAG: methyltransferase domain-containing protein [Alphaproteobacteria bacterium]
MSSLADTKAAWDRIATAYDRTVTPTHLQLGDDGLTLAGLRPGMTFLDVATGSGSLSIPAARLGAKVLATDLSPVMLDRLEQRASEEGLDIETRVMDGQALELDDGSFDMAGSQFGVMLFPDMPRGIGEMARVVKPGGRVLVTAFGDPRKVEFFAILVDAIQSVRPDFTGPPMDPPPLPFQLQDPERLRSELRSAGLADVRVETGEEPLVFRTGAELWTWQRSSNPIVERLLADLAITSSEREDIEEALEQRVRNRVGGDGGAVLTCAINFGVGVK